MPVNVKSILDGSGPPRGTRLYSAPALKGIMSISRDQRQLLINLANTFLDIPKDASTGFLTPVVEDDYELRLADEMKQFGKDFWQSQSLRQCFFGNPFDTVERDFVLKMLCQSFGKVNPFETASDLL